MPLSASANADDVIAALRGLGSQANIDGMARYGIRPAKTFGVSISVLRPLARQIGRDHARALTLWESGWRDARLLAAFTADETKLTFEEAAQWAAGIDSWDVVDGTADLFADASFWPRLVEAFATDEREYVRRMAFAILVWACVHRKKEPDETFIAHLPLIEAHARDPRNFVKKAVNWALRQIGKRSLRCHAPALTLARELAASPDRTARWVGADAVRELTKPSVIERAARRK